MALADEGNKQIELEALVQLISPQVFQVRSYVIEISM